MINPPTISIHIYLVPHGYQVDIHNRVMATPDGQGIITNTECRDFAHSYDPAMSSQSIVTHILEELRRIESKRWMGTTPAEKGGNT